jgi:hypothetical protein
MREGKNEDQKETGLVLCINSADTNADYLYHTEFYDYQLV